MKKEDFNNPYRRTPNRIGSVKGGMDIFQEPTRVTHGRVEEVEPTFEDLFDGEEHEIEITISIPQLIFWLTVVSLVDLLFSR